MSETVYFEGFTPGRKFVSPKPRKIEDSTIRQFAELSGDKNALHLDDDFAKASPFKERIGHGLLGLSVASGLLHDIGIVQRSIMAFAGLDWKFKSPIRIGDELSLTMTVTKVRSVGAQGGIVWFDSTVTNQKREVLQQGVWSLMVRRKGAPAAGK